MSSPELEIRISGNASAFKESLEQTARAVDNLSDHLTESGLNVHHILETALGVEGAELFHSVLEKIGETVKEVFSELVTESVKAAQVHEDSIQRMNIALAGAGEYSKAASHEMAEFAAGLQRTTAYEEDNILQASSLIETLGKLDQEGLKKATTAAVNLSAALKIDLNQAATLIGKAAEGNITAFKRYGLQIQEGTTKAETFANVLARVAEMGDVATLQAQTYSGAVAQLSHAHEDGHKILGAVITQNQAVTGVIRAVTEAMFAHNEETQKNIQSYKELVGEGILLAIDAIAGLVSAIDAVFRVGQIAFYGIKGAVDAVSLGIITLIDGPVALLYKGLSLLPGIGDEFAKKFNDIMANAEIASKAVNDDADGMSKAISGPKEMTLEFQDKLLKIREAAAIGLNAVRSGAVATVEPINMSTHAVEELSEELVKLADNGVKLAQKLNGADLERKYKSDLAALKEANKQKKLSDEEYTAAAKELDIELQADRASEREREYNELLARNKLLIDADDQKNKAEIENNKAKMAKILAQEKENSNLRLKNDKEYSSAVQKIEQAKMDALQTTFGNFAALQRSGHSELVAAGKAAAIAQATIATYMGATKAAASAADIPGIGFILAPIVAASFIAAGLANVATISGVGFAHGGLVTGGIAGVDSVPAMLMPGELVAPERNFDEVVNAVASQRAVEMRQGSEGDGPSAAGSAYIELALKDELAEVVEAKIIKRQRLGISLIPKFT